MPKVSVIIPAYNAMAYLPSTLESVLRQTFVDIEVVIVNDGSSDSIADWASGLNDERIKLISQRNQGSASARNAGIANSTGQYVAFLDADDLWEPTKLEKQVRCLDDCLDVGLVNTWMRKIDSQGHPIGAATITNAEGNIWQQIAEENIVLCGSAPLVRRRCFENLGVFDTSFHLQSSENHSYFIDNIGRTNLKIFNSTWTIE